MGKKAGSGQRKVRSTAVLGIIDGWTGPPSPKVTAGHVRRSYAGKRALVENGGVRNMPFSQTNPPCFASVFGVLGSATDGYNSGRRVFSVGSFWKTNPPEHHKRGLIERRGARFWVHLPQTLLRSCQCSARRRTVDEVDMDDRRGGRRCFCISFLVFVRHCGYADV